MKFDLELSGPAIKALNDLRAFDRRRLTNEIEEQLSHQPTVATRNRKKLDDVSADFEFIPPLWELRSGDIRVFYDVDESIRESHDTGDSQQKARPDIGGGSS